MPFRAAEAHLRDILESIRFIAQFVDGIDFDAYREKEQTKSAVERKLQILTEAIIRLERDDPQPYPDIEWAAYRGLGNVLRHSYHRVDDQIVWNTIEDDLPKLRVIVEAALQKFSEEPSSVLPPTLF